MVAFRISVVHKDKLKSSIPDDYNLIQINNFVQPCVNYMILLFKVNMYLLFLLQCVLISVLKRVLEGCFINDKYKINRQSVFYMIILSNSNN